MYQMLDQKTVYTPTQKYFIEKHKEIYDVINPSNIQVKVIDEKIIWFNIKYRWIL